MEEEDLFPTTPVNTLISVQISANLSQRRKSEIHKVGIRRNILKCVWSQKKKVPRKFKVSLTGPTLKTGINRDKGHLKERMDQGNVRNGCQPEVTSISGDDS